MALSWGVCPLASGSAAIADAPMPSLAGPRHSPTEASSIAAPAESGRDTTRTARDDDPPVAEESPSAESARTSSSDHLTHIFRPIPEPKAWLIAFCGLATLVALQRFRRRRGRTP